MKTKTYHVLFLISIYWVIFLFHGTVGHCQDSRAIKWHEDIDYLIKHLEIMHPNLYANISRETFLGYADQLKNKITTSTEVEMIFGIQELVALIKNTHTICRPVLFMNIPKELKQQFQYYPVFYYPFEDGLYVIATTEKYKSVLGRKVVKIGNLTIAEVKRSEMILQHG